MATIKVFSALGVKELKCFDTLFNVPYIEDIDVVEFAADEDLQAADDSVDF